MSSPFQNKYENKCKNGFGIAVMMITYQGLDNHTPFSYNIIESVIYYVGRYTTMTIDELDKLDLTALAKMDIDLVTLLNEDTLDLSYNEKVVYMLLAQGRTNAEIARQLGAPKTPAELLMQEQLSRYRHLCILCWWIGFFGALMIPTLRAFNTLLFASGIATIIEIISAALYGIFYINTKARIKVLYEAMRPKPIYGAAVPLEMLMPCIWQWMLAPCLLITAVIFRIAPFPDNDMAIWACGLALDLVFCMVVRNKII